MRAVRDEPDPPVAVHDVGDVDRSAGQLVLAVAREGVEDRLGVEAGGRAFHSDSGVMR